MTKSILVAIFAAVLGTSVLAAPNLTVRSLDGQRLVLGSQAVAMQSICVRGTCCYWGNNGDFWACTPR